MNTQSAKLFIRIILSDKPVRIKLLGDGLHPNDRGYAVIFRLLMQELGIAVPHKDIQLA